jgi:hypothetical protein
MDNVSESVVRKTRKRAAILPNRKSILDYMVRLYTTHKTASDRRPSQTRMNVQRNVSHASAESARITHHGGYGIMEHFPPSKQIDNSSETPVSLAR